MLSYNSETPTANWVSSQLNRSWIGAADREDNLRPDNALPAAQYKVRPSDNTGNGYNRKEKIAVSAKNWKIIAVLDRQGLGMQSVDANTSEARAVMMPNDSSVKGSGWKSFRVSVDLVERETGLNFLSNVPSQVQQVIESKVDSQ